MTPFHLFRDDRAKVDSIKKKTLRMILEASKSSYPEEFGAILRATKGAINELILLPGTVQGERSALFKLHMLPIDFTVVGTVHSHPSGVCFPSRADVDLFRRFGWIHIIVCRPYSMSSWAAFDANGEPRELKVVD